MTLGRQAFYCDEGPSVRPSACLFLSDVSCFTETISLALWPAYLKYLYTGTQLRCESRDIFHIILSFRNSRTSQGILSQFKDFSRLYANSRSFQDKQSNSRTFRYCTNTAVPAFPSRGSLVMVHEIVFMHPALFLS